MIDGVTCAPGNEIGDPSLDPEGRPTAKSTLLIGRADERYATTRRSPGKASVDPDIGAYEYPAP